MHNKLTPPKHFFLVEDDEIDRMSLLRLLKFHIDVELDIATDGQEAICKLTGKEGYDKITYPDLILLDINLPKISGLEVLKFIRESDEYHQANVMMLTTSDSKSDIEKASSLGLISYINKPIEYADLQRTLQYIDY